MNNSESLLVVCSLANDKSFSSSGKVKVEDGEIFITDQFEPALLADYDIGFWFGEYYAGVENEDLNFSVKTTN
jgi:hypothetical protein|tara:strand:- start:7012 stop:7230 length:219 start_codon:yes stop_codon:yes gene_type:complete